MRDPRESLISETGHDGPLPEFFGEFSPKFFGYFRLTNFRAWIVEIVRRFVVKLCKLTVVADEGKNGSQRRFLACLPLEVTHNLW